MWVFIEAIFLHHPDPILPTICIIFFNFNSDICILDIHNKWTIYFYLYSSESAGNKLLKQLSKINRPYEIDFKEMLDLMHKCDIVEKQNLKRKDRPNANPSDENASKAFEFKNNPFSVFSGIIPGTKWYVEFIERDNLVQF